MARNHQDNPLRPYLLAAWPGMGNVAVIAAGYLIRKLGMEPAGTVPLTDVFDLNHVEVRSGVIERPHMPRGLLFRTPQDHEGRPLFVFLGEAQPSRKGHAFVHALLERLRDDKIERVFTFASLASQTHPAEPSRVSAAVTSRNLLDDLEALAISATSDGQIGGLNGLLLGAAAEREIDGVCLLAEIPFYAMNVPNPKAARAALVAFCELVGVEIDLDELNRHAEAGEQALIRMLEQLQRSYGEGEHYGPDNEDDQSARASPAPRRRETGRASKLDPAAEARIEQLFKDAESDHRLAFELKSELDKHGVFAEYEDRFLDLFKRAE